MKKETKMTIYAALASIALLVLLAILGSLLSIGDHLMSVTPVLGILFYLIVAALVFAGLLWPVLQVLKSPIFSLYMLRDEQGRAKARWCRRLVSNLSRNTMLTADEEKQLNDYLTRGDEADDLLIDFFKKKFTPIVNDDMKKAARTAFVTTAVSQTALYDMLSMLSINLNLIKAIVRDCGYRPTGISLAKLYLRVMTIAFFSGGLEDMDLEELLPLITGNASMKLPGIVMASAAQGLVNAFMTYRVGVITKKYLFAEHGPISAQEVKKESYGEALSLMKSGGLGKDMMDILMKRFGSMKDSAVNAVKNTTDSAMNTIKNTGSSAMNSIKNAFSFGRKDKTAAAADSRSSDNAS